MCTVAPSSNRVPGNATIQGPDQTVYWKYHLGVRKWEKKIPPILNDKEKDILLLSLQGYTMVEIADKLCMAIDTTKFHKRRIFDKLHAKNITQALSYVANHKLW